MSTSDKRQCERNNDLIENSLLGLFIPQICDYGPGGGPDVYYCLFGSSAQWPYGDPGAFRFSAGTSIYYRGEDVGACMHLSM